MSCRDSSRCSDWWCGCFVVGPSSRENQFQFPSRLDRLGLDHSSLAHKRSRPALHGVGLNLGDRPARVPHLVPDLGKSLRLVPVPEKPQGRASRALSRRIAIREGRRNRGG